MSDNGCYIPKEIRPRIFELFFTTKLAGEGTGLEQKEPYLNGMALFVCTILSLDSLRSQPFNRPAR
jgi:hypothetical protein